MARRFRHLFTAPPSLRRRPSFSSSTLEAQQEQWVLFSALELRDQSERVQIASFLSRLRSLAERRAPASPSSASTEATAISTPGEMRLMISMESVGFQRAPSSDPQTITPGFAKDLLRFFARGGTLAPQEFLHILQQSAEQLAREPTVTFLPPPIGDAAPGDEGGAPSDGPWAKMDALMREVSRS